MANKDVFHALSSPTRRQLLELLRVGARSVNQLTAVLTVSQPAVSQHLHVLQDADLVRVRREGNQRIYSLNPRGLITLRKYVEALWDDVLQAYEHVANLNVKEEMDG
jgi:DNA-binding transcriptional ArsR family regulator